MKNYFIQQSNLLNIKPGKIIIENFIPGKIYRRTFEIENISNIPIIINLKESDKSRLLLNKTLLRLEVREKQIIELIIQDKLKYTNLKYPIDPRILYINITGELIEAKYIITLFYNQNKNKFKESKNYNNNSVRYQTNENDYEMQIPSFYMTKYQKPLYSKNFMNSRKLIIDKTANIIIKRVEKNKILFLKNTIKYLKHQNLLLAQKNKKYEFNEPKNFKIENNSSLFILKNKLEESDDKLKIDDEIEKKALINKNASLEVENSILVERIKYLENLINKNDFEKYNFLKGINSNDDNKDYNKINNNNDYNNYELNEQDEEQDADIHNDINDKFYSDDNITKNINYYDEFLFD